MPAIATPLEAKRLEADQISGRAEAGADPVTDAAAAARRGEYGLLGIPARRERPIVPGLLCRIPYRSSPEIRAIFEGDRPATVKIHDGNGNGRTVSAAVSRYILAYNRALVDQPTYPDPDLCRPSIAGERMRNEETSLPTPVRLAGRPPRTLHAAARYGSAADIARFGEKAPIDAADVFGMTPLAWAVVRDNRTAAAALLARGADPWGLPQTGRTPIYWAARFARPALFQQLLAASRQPPKPWPEHMVRAAANGGDQAILARMLADAHEPVRFSGSDDDLPPLASLAQLLADDRGITDALLHISTKNEFDLAYVDLALKAGADVNATDYFGETPLGRAAASYSARSLPIAQRLLAAGADPDRLSRGERPAVIAFKRLVSAGGPYMPGAAIPLTIFNGLMAAGADLHLPDADGIPTIRSILFPYRHSRDDFEPGTIDPAALALLVASGADVNAVWNGRRVLSLVLQQTAPDSIWPRTLRRLGAVE